MEMRYVCYLSAMYVVLSNRLRVYRFLANLRFYCARVFCMHRYLREQSTRVYFNVAFLLGKCR